ncbi:MAG: PGF-CTERM sorting domain-containing protein [Methanosarcinales archaeon]|nr:PGF-CTERM sorting domain-containing protein [Methanosarcinales archaeon]
MRIFLTTILVLLLTAMAAMAAGPQGIHEPGTGLASANASTNASMNGQAGGTPGANGIHEPGTGIAEPEVKESRIPGQGQDAAESEAEKTSSTPGFEATLALTGIACAALLIHRSR